MDLIEKMRKATGQSAVQKVDPNTQQPQNEQSGSANLLAQAAIPVSLLGLYKYTRSEDNAKTLIGENNTTDTNWKNRIFGDHTDDVTQQISSYAHTSTDKADEALNNTIGTAIKVVNQSLGKDVTATGIAGVFTDNRSVILQHLPASLQIGSVLEDNTVDDRTNKMEGPISGLMHAFEQIFSDSDANDSNKV